MTVKPATLSDTLLPIVTAVQRLLAETATPGAKTFVPPPQPGPPTDSMEFAQRVVQRFLASQGDALRRGIEPADVSDSLLKLLLEEDSHRRLARNQWNDLRNAVRQASMQLGAALEALHETVRTLGLGYRPTLVELGAFLRSLVAKNGGVQNMTPQLLEQMVKSSAISFWQAALVRLWTSRKKGSLSPALADEDLETLFLDASALEELAVSGDGPWDAYVAQAAALRAHRHLANVLENLSP
jgi:hypothetical protein